MGAFDLSVRRVCFDAGFDVSLMLEGGHHCEKVGCGRVSVRPHHPHQAFLGDVGFLAQRAEANGCVDAIAQEDEAGRDFAVEERLQRLLQKGGFEGGVALGARDHRLAIADASAAILAQYPPEECAAYVRNAGYVQSQMQKALATGLVCSAKSFPAPAALDSRSCASSPATCSEALVRA
jgi:hypothetical protein